MTNNLQDFFPTVITRLYQSRRKLATFGVGFLACVLGYHVIFGANGLMVYEQKRKEYRQLLEQNRSLQQQNEDLEQQNKALKTDPQAIEKEAREGMHYARSGEVVYTLQAKPAPTAAAHK
ncbi:MAG TPA: septum formation initiator family protein [Candidatus Angelobacter sp.]|nr:septum formation initiator family protein [Candidatus Angelobacter sp.]